MPDKPTQQVGLTISLETALANASGHYNTMVGNKSGAGDTTGPYNAFLGGASGVQNTTGSGNVFLGMNAGYNNTTGGYRERYSGGEGLQLTKQ